MSEQNLESYSNSEKEEKGFEEVNFEEIEDKLNKEFDEIGQKPLFESNTNATIKGIELIRAQSPKTDKKGKEFYDMILKVTCIIDGQTDSEGKPLETTDNYGGLREYPNGLWNGPDSAFGKLRTKAEEEDSNIKTYTDLLRFLPQKKVKIRTERPNYQGQEFKKNVIQAFR
jgi:hypothetical protein